MNSMRRTLIGLVAAAGLLLSSLAVFSIGGGSITRDLPLDTRLLACLPVNAWQDAGESAPLDTSCVTGVMVDALKENKILDLEPTMTRMDTRNSLRTLCHEAAHAAGQQIFRETGDWRASVDVADRLVCNSGLLHGVFDGLAKQRVSSDQWVAIAAWCSDVSKRQSGQGNCGDATGHAAWDASRSSAEALGVCALITVDFLASQCAEGIVMQQFTPASRLDESIPLPRASVLEVCAASVGLAAPLRSGCLKGIGYVTGTSLELQSRDGSDLTGEQLRAVIRDGLSYCSPFAAEASDCMVRYWETMFFRLRQQPNPVDFICSAVKDQEQVCRGYLREFKLT